MNRRAGMGCSFTRRCVEEELPVASGVLEKLAPNALTLLRASLRNVHKAQAVSEMSSCYLAEEVRTTRAGMKIALPVGLWEPLGALSVECFAELLRQIARRIDPTRYRKAKRGPKKPRPPTDRYQNGDVISIQRLLLQQ